MTTQSPATTSTSRARIALVVALAALAAVAAVVLAATTAHAQDTFEVTTTDDTTQCDDDDCGLRGAINEAQADPDTAVVITVPAGDYVLDQGGRLQIMSEITIEGAGQDATVIDGDGDDRVFSVVDDGDLTLDGVQVTGGDAGQAGGGGIEVGPRTGGAALTLSDARVTGNAAGNYGGGIAVSDGSATDGISVEITNGSVIDDNATNNRGGGIAVVDTESPTDIVVSDSTVSDNQAGVGGGGIHHEPAGRPATLEIVRSTVSGNTTNGTGGGVHQAGGEAEIENSTLSGNDAFMSGGGLANVAGATTVLEHVTIANNNVQADEGGGTAVHNEGEMAALATLIAENVVGQFTPTCSEIPINSQGYNLEDGDSCGFDDATDLTDTDADLEPLALNAPGQTETHALSATSPAVDHVDADTVNIDQRGVARPGAGSAARDIGAYELLQSDLEITKTAPSPVLVGEEFDYVITVTNAGPTTEPAVTVTDDLPAQVEFESVDPATNCDNYPPGEVSCQIGDLAPGESETVTVTVTAVTPTSAATNEAVAASETTPDGVTASTDVAITLIPFPCPPEDYEDGTQRIWGDDRFETAIDVSESCYDDGEADAVVLTRADIFPDALSGTPLATQENAPLLFTLPEELHQGTEGELQRVLPAGGNVYLLGETEALSAQVEARVEQLGYNAVRLGGADRYETAVEIVEQGLNNPGSLLLATGIDFPDPLAGATGEAIDGGVLLTAGTQMADPTADYLAERTDDPEVYAIGGPAASAAPDATGIVGQDRYETAVMVAEEFFGSPTSVGIATGGDFADALSGGVQLGKLGGPMLLVQEDELPEVVEDYLEANATSIQRALIFGGATVVDTAVEDAVDDAIEP